MRGRNVCGIIFDLTSWLKPTGRQANFFYEISMLGSDHPQDSDAKIAAFTVQKVALSASNGLRLGTLSLPGTRPIQTPNFLAITSRGVVPHISPDILRKKTSVNGVYVALEDCTSSLVCRSSCLTDGSLQVVKS